MPQTANIVNFPTGATLEVNGKHIDLLPGGGLKNLADWNEDVARAIASRSGIELGEDHWAVIHLMRRYYGEFNVSPVRKLLRRALHAEGHEQLVDDAVLDGLFPGDVMVQGSKVAGVPVPHLDAELEYKTYGATKAATAQAGHFTDSFEFEGKTFQVTHVGNLLDMAGWNERLAGFMAEKEGITLTDEHWEVLNFLRSFYFEYGITPMVKILMKHMKEELGEERASREHLYQLFPKGPSRQGSRFAGLPEPQGCIDG